MEINPSFIQVLIDRCSNLRNQQLNLFNFKWNQLLNFISHSVLQLILPFLGLLPEIKATGLIILKTELQVWVQFDIRSWLGSEIAEYLKAIEQPAPKPRKDWLNADFSQLMKDRYAGWLNDSWLMKPNGKKAIQTGMNSINFSFRARTFQKLLELNSFKPVCLRLLSSVMLLYHSCC